MRSELRELDSALDQVASGDVETRVLAVDRVVGATGWLARQAVNALAQPGPARLFVAERLGQLGSCAVEPLQDLLRHVDDPQVRVLAAAVLTQIGAPSGPQVLQEAVEQGNAEVCLAATWLARSGAIGAGEVIERRLARCSLDQADLIVCLLTALETLGRTVPETLRSSLESEAAPEQVRTVLRTTQWPNTQ